MQRPEVRVIDNQQVTSTNPDIDQSEADYLLAKYGYKQNYTAPSQTSNPHQNSQSFEDMVRSQEAEQRRIEEERYRRMNGPKSVSFDNQNINYSEIKWSDMEVDGSKLGIKIQIVTDMKIN